MNRYWDPELITPSEQFAGHAPHCSRVVMGGQDVDCFAMENFDKNSTEMTNFEIMVYCEEVIVCEVEQIMKSHK